MSSLPNRERFESAYTGKPPWDIGRPQRAFVEVAERGLRGRGSRSVQGGRGREGDPARAGRGPHRPGGQLVQRGRAEGVVFVHSAGGLTQADGRQTTGPWRRDARPSSGSSAGRSW